MQTKPSPVSSDLSSSKERSLPMQVANLLNSAVGLVKSEARVTQLAGEEYVHRVIAAVIGKVFGGLLALLGIHFLSTALVLFLRKQYGIEFSTCYLSVGAGVIGLGLLLFIVSSFQKK